MMKKLFINQTALLMAFLMLGGLTTYASGMCIRANVAQIKRQPLSPS